MNTKTLCEEIKKSKKDAKALNLLGLGLTDADTYERLYPEFFK